jgi:hypothetical protein
MHNLFVITNNSFVESLQLDVELQKLSLGLSADQLVAGPGAPGGDILFRSHVVGQEFQDLAGFHFLDFLCEMHDRHRAHQAPRVESGVFLQA